MTIDTRQAREAEALRGQPGSRMEPDGQPDARAMGAESAAYTEPQIDPQWLDAWKIFEDSEGAYGIPVKLPRGQWSAGGPNALQNLRHPSGRYCFTLVTPERTQAEPQYGCFIEPCQKKLHHRRQVPPHVRAIHFEESKSHEAILKRIEAQVVREDPRLRKLITELEQDELEEAKETEARKSGLIETHETPMKVPTGLPDPVQCGYCEKKSPDGHAEPMDWLARHGMASHKDEIESDD